MNRAERRRLAKAAASQLVADLSRSRSKGAWKRDLIQVVAGAIVGFIVGVLGGQWAQQQWLGFLPGATVATELQGFEGEGPTKGCVFFVFSFRPSEAVEHIHARLQFPGPINNYTPIIPIDTRSGSLRSARWTMEAEKKDGKCLIVRPPDENTDFQIRVVGSGVTMKASKVPAKDVVGGAVALNETEGELAVQGSYEYLKWGQTLKKELLWPPRPPMAKMLPKMPPK